jgi:hypothetical protein
LDDAGRALELEMLNICAADEKKIDGSARTLPSGTN